MGSKHAARPRRAPPAGRGPGRNDPGSRVRAVRPGDGPGKRRAEPLRELAERPRRAGLRAGPPAGRSRAPARGRGRPAHARGERHARGIDVPPFEPRGGTRHRALRPRFRLQWMHRPRLQEILRGSAGAHPLHARRPPLRAATTATEASGRGAPAARHIRGRGPDARGGDADRQGRCAGFRDRAGLHAGRTRRGPRGWASSRPLPLQPRRHDRSRRAGFRARRDAERSHRGLSRAQRARATSSGRPRRRSRPAPNRGAGRLRGRLGGQGGARQTSDPPLCGVTGR